MHGRVKALGEIALRVENLDTMHKFYEEVVGLSLLKRFKHAAFFKIADGLEGHTQILALFDRSESPDYTGLEQNTTTLDHLAFAISLNDFEIERRRLQSHGLQVERGEHAWTHWRSLYVRDPEGNLVEFVATTRPLNDKAIQRSAASDREISDGLNPESQHGGI